MIRNIPNPLPRKYMQETIVQFTDSQEWIERLENSRIGTFLTKGARFVADLDTGPGYQLIGLILSHNIENHFNPDNSFSRWTLKADDDDQNLKTLTCEDCHGAILKSIEMGHCNFPLKEITLYYFVDTIMLPSEWSCEWANFTLPPEWSEKN